MTGRKTILVLLMLCTSASFAQTQTKQLTLQEALTLAVENSNELKLSKAKLAIAQAKVSQAKDQAWPEVKASATYLRINSPDVSFKGAEPETDGDSEPGALASFANINSIGLAQLSVTQPIFAGFRIRNTRVMQEYLNEAANYDQTTTKNKVLLNTAKAIYQYYQLLETKKLLDQNLQQAKQRVTEFANLENQGVLARNDRLKADLQVNNIEYTRTEVNNNLQLAEYSLIILLGLPDNTSIQLDTVGMFKNPSFNTGDNFEQRALENRADIKSAQVQAEAGKAGTQIAKASRYPTLAFTGGYVNMFIPDVVTVTNALNGGLALQYNLSNVFHNKHQIQEAKAKQLQAELSAKIVNDQAKIDVRKKFLNYQKSLEKIELSKRSIEQAQENFNISKNKYNAGLMILSDYLDADVTLLQKQIDYATAKAESMIAYYELEESTGTLNKIF
ncbi:TolC family protein [Chryseosolibacter indicus]|uniref:TolC family protein n=1 Tax=Chryseosolibacter indicus TaxID=2782351 RepID=A0ABS5VYT8_9BACT|nr:TolC family protein [Chryseosolibacter indicus]MBT1706223.1 TolC family protein [Chryseosolibacter indicus]